jgi:hypothetical protein
MLKFIRAIAATAVLVIAQPLWAADLPQPTGPVILTVTGEIGTSNGDGAARFDLEMLEALGATTFKTATIWTEGVQQFEGVSLKALTDTLGITSGKLRATAINDYSVEIPLSDAVEDGAIIAYRLDGETMSVRDKGPLWVVYPYDMNSDFRSEVVYSRSIWQLDRIETVK